MPETLDSRVCPALTPQTISSVLLLDPSRKISANQRRKLKQMIKKTYNLTSVGSQAAMGRILDSIHFTAVPYRSLSVHAELGKATVTFSDTCPRDMLRERLREKTNRGTLWSRYRELKKRLPIIPSPTDISSNEEQSRMVLNMLTSSDNIDPVIDTYYKDCLARIPNK